MFMHGDFLFISEDEGGYFFRPDPLLVDRYLNTVRRKAYLEPEKRLLLAILEEAVACFQKHLFAQKDKRKTLFRQAEEWILEENSDWICSFESACEALDIDPTCLRGRLLKWKEKKLRERAGAKVHFESRWEECGNGESDLQSSPVSRLPAEFRH